MLASRAAHLEAGAAETVRIAIPAAVRRRTGRLRLLRFTLRAELIRPDGSVGTTDVGAVARR